MSAVDQPASGESAALHEVVIEALRGRVGRGLTAAGEERVLAHLADVVLDAVGLEQVSFAEITMGGARGPFYRPTQVGRREGDDA